MKQSHKKANAEPKTMSELSWTQTLDCGWTSEPEFAIKCVSLLTLTSQSQEKPESVDTLVHTSLGLTLTLTQRTHRTLTLTPWRNLRALVP